jgi:hypothetical protein
MAMTVRQAEAVAIARGIKGSAIDEIKHRIYSDDYSPAAQAKVDEDRAVAICEAAGVSVDADAQAIIDQAWKDAPRNGAGEVDDRTALRLARASTLLEN